MLKQVQHILSYNHNYLLFQFGIQCKLALHAVTNQLRFFNHTLRQSLTPVHSIQEAAGKEADSDSNRFRHIQFQTHWFTIFLQYLNGLTRAHLNIVEIWWINVSNMVNQYGESICRLILNLLSGCHPCLTSCWGSMIWTHLPRWVSHICVSELGHHWFK